MAIYQPYFYIIQDIENLKYYAGCKYSKDADPTLLLVENGYHTSSGTIKKLIAENGLLRFAIKKIRVFSTGDQAYEYETRFLKKVNARCNDRFYNSHNNDGVLPSYGTEKYKNLMRQKYGDDANHKIPSIREKTRQTVFERYGVNTPLESSEIRAKTQETVLRKYGVKNAWQRPENQAKIDMKKRGESISKTKSDPVWKETIGKAAILKQVSAVDQVAKSLKITETKSDPIWKETIGKETGRKLSAIMCDPVWKETTGKRARALQLANTDQIQKGNKVSAMRNNPEWQAVNHKQCPHCNWRGNPGTYGRYHGDKCTFTDGGKGGI